MKEMGRQNLVAVLPFSVICGILKPPILPGELQIGVRVTWSVLLSGWVARNSGLFWGKSGHGSLGARTKYTTMRLRPGILADMIHSVRKIQPVDIE